jgi:hypothetical protein
MQYTIDRFEGNFAVVELENETFVNIPRSAIPSEAKEGDVITVMVDKGETEKREKRIKELEGSLFVD